MAGLAHISSTRSLGEPQGTPGWAALPPTMGKRLSQVVGEIWATQAENAVFSSGRMLQGQVEGTRRPHLCLRTSS